MSSIYRGTAKNIPTPTKDNLLDVVRALKDALDLREGRTPNRGLRFVTAAELEAAGLVTVEAGSSPVSGPGAYVTSVTGTAPINSTGGQTPVISLNDEGVTYAKMQEISSGFRLLGNPLAYPAVPSEVAAGFGVSLDGTVHVSPDLLAYIAHRG